MLYHHLMRQAGIIKELGLDETNLCKYVLKIESGYNASNPYHNRYFEGSKSITCDWSQAGPCCMLLLSYALYPTLCRRFVPMWWAVQKSAVCFQALYLAANSHNVSSVLDTIFWATRLSAKADLHHDACPQFVVCHPPVPAMMCCNLPMWQSFAPTPRACHGIPPPPPPHTVLVASLPNSVLVASLPNSCCCLLAASMWPQCCK